MSDSTKLCFVIPAYNEASVISKVVSDLNLVLKSEPYNFKIVVADDGSKDNTANVASKAGATIIKHILIQVLVAQLQQVFGMLNKIISTLQLPWMQMASIMQKMPLKGLL